MNTMDRGSHAMFGLLVADAAGRPFEFHRPSSIPADMPLDGLATPAAPFQEAHAGTPEGTWTDDGAGALALADALTPVTAREEPIETALFRNLLRWYRDGAYTPDGRVFDIGNATRAALTHGPKVNDNFSANGNGSLMRVLPVAIYCLSDEGDGTDESIVDLAMRSSAVTHPHEISKAACALYCLAAAELLIGVGNPLDAFARARTRLASIDRRAASILVDNTPAHATGGGFVLDSLRFAITSVESGWSYEDTVRRAIALGNDTDTTAAIAGGLVACGARSRRTVIPASWLGALKGFDVANPIISRLCK